MTRIAMTFNAPRGASVIIFCLVVVLVVAAFVYGVHFASSRDPAARGRARQRTVIVAVCAAAWLAILAGAVGSGVVQASPMPALMILFFASNAVAVALSRIGGWLAAGTPLGALLGFQAFRLPLELVLHDWARQGSILRR